MENSIQFLSSSAYVVSRCKAVFDENDYDFPIAQVNFNDLEAFAFDALSNGAKVFVSRGKSAALLKKLNLDVVSLRFTYYDFFTAMQRALTISNKIAVLGYEDSWPSAIEPYYEMLNKPYFINIENASELDDALARLKEKGIEVIICGHTAHKFAQRHGLKTVQIGLENSSILDSIEEAKYLLRIKQQRSSHEALLSTIFNNTVEGVVSVDEQGTIINANQKAIHVLGKSCIRENISNYISDLALLPGGERTIRFRHELCKVNNVLCTINISSFIDPEQRKITIYFFQPIAQIQSLEQNIRAKQITNTTVAKAHFSNIICKAPRTAATIETAKQFAQSDSSILIHGEIGTGKEIYAQSIHNYSSHYAGPFVTVNCSSLSPEAFERDLFGYIKPSYLNEEPETIPGYLELADGGSIFLDEISEIPLSIQGKLLRAIQEGEIRRIGSNDIIRINVRIIAATSQNLSELLREKKFREDLFYRLSVLELLIPPLRERREDIIPIAEDLLAVLSKRSNIGLKKLDISAQKMLSSMDWPGNIRQLQNILERAVITTTSSTITASQLSKLGTEPIMNRSTVARRKISSQERDRIFSALREANGNRLLAAQKLGISSTTLWRRISAIEITEPDFLTRIYK